MLSTGQECCTCSLAEQHLFIETGIWKILKWTRRAVQDMPSSVPQLQAELQRARGERDALESRLKLLLQTRRAAGDSSAAAEASAAAAQLQSTAGAPGASRAKLGVVHSTCCPNDPLRNVCPIT